MHKYDADDNKHGNKGVRPFFFVIGKAKKVLWKSIEETDRTENYDGVKKIANHDQDPLVRTLVNLSSISYPSIKT